MSNEQKKTGTTPQPVEAGAGEVKIAAKCELVHVQFLDKSGQEHTKLGVLLANGNLVFIDERHSLSKPAPSWLTAAVRTKLDEK